MKDKKEAECIRCKEKSECESDRFECRSCKLAQCRKCKSAHEGLSCKEFKVKSKLM